MISRISTVAFEGIKVKDVDVQVVIAKGLPSFNIVGLADKAVSESKERLRAAFASLGTSLPAERITVNLSPANLSKEGSHFDLPIALAILGAMDIIPKESLTKYIAMGEIALDGEITPVKGVLATCLFASQESKDLIIPFKQAKEAFLAKDRIKVLPINNLLEIIKHFKGEKEIKVNITTEKVVEKNQFIDIGTIKGHNVAKRVLEIAASGKHNCLMIGPPGSGKSMLANALGGISPKLTKEEALEVSLIYSIAGELNNQQFITSKPYRSPHHSTSLPALVGGGTKVKPGEITLAHKGILFLDELAEYNKNILDSLRQPLENGSINIARVHSHITYPADFQLIAAMNPCRCGYFGDDERTCSKAPKCAEDYQSKISGPILDRIDLIIEVMPVSLERLDQESDENMQKEVRQRVLQAREIQNQRYKNYKFNTNNQMTSEAIDRLANLEKEAKEVLQESVKIFKFSTRTYYKLIKVARTIADLELSKSICKHHMIEAISYRKINYYHKLLKS